jgi:hypothetical protein
MPMLAYLAGLGVLLGIAVPLPAFAILLIAILVLYALLGGEVFSGAGPILSLISAAVALQFGYFLAVLVRVQVIRTFGTRDLGNSSEDKDTGPKSP